MNVFILTEGSKDKGLGHISRCSSIYQAFKEKGLSVNFFIDGDNSIEPILKNIDYSIVDWLNDGRLYFKFNSDDIIIVDSYIADENFFKKLSKLTNNLYCFDDNNRLDYFEGIVINGTISANYLDYDNVKKSKYLLGSKYIPLRKNFWESQPIKIRNNVQDILITMGGNDLRNLSPFLIRLLNNNFPDFKIKIIVTDSFLNMEEINELVDDNVEVFHSPNANEIKNLMISSDIAIAACGQTLYEFARLGIPTIGIGVIENQKNNILNWTNQGFLEFAGFYDDVNLEENLIKKIKLLINKNKRIEKQKLGISAVDGKGSIRITNKILSNYFKNNVNLRKVRKDDCFKIYEIANDEEVRKSSFNSNKIELSDHKKWFEKILKDEFIEFLVLEYEKDIVGQLRFDLSENSPIVSISLNKKYRGLGLSKVLLSKSLDYLKNNYDYTDVYAYIKKDNFKSISFFQSMGFKLVDQDDNSLKFKKVIV